MQTTSWFLLNRYIDYTMYAENHAICRTLVFCNFYFELAMYHWLLVEGIYLYMKVGLVYNSDRIRLWMYKLVGWGFPAFIMGIWTALMTSKSNQHVSWRL